MIQCKKEINAGEDENPFQFILITPLKILAMFVGENLQSKSLFSNLINVSFFVKIKRAKILFLFSQESWNTPIFHFKAFGATYHSLFSSLSSS